MKSLIEIKAGLLTDADAIQQHCAELANNWVIIADENVLEQYAKPLQKILHCHLLSITATETHKTREQKQLLENELFALGCNRDTGLIALGGGITTDLVGFVAATFARGLPLIYIPTTLLAMVDASVGGKTGVNTEHGKNLIGSFYPPNAIFIDPNVLTTLPKHLFYDGMAEVIKHALIADVELFHWLQDNVENILNLDMDTLVTLIQKNIAIKQHIVTQDEKEQGIRQLLNLGHTIAHGLEIASGYQLSHGQAVGLGLIAELFIATKMELCDATLLEQTKKLLHRYHLPTQITAYPLSTMLDALKFDKKNKDHAIHCCLLTACGKPYVDNQQYSHPVSLSLLTTGFYYLTTK